jgi:hypothetical protein
LFICQNHNTVYGTKAARYIYPHPISCKKILETIGFWNLSAIGCYNITKPFLGDVDDISADSEDDWEDENEDFALNEA